MSADGWLLKGRTKPYTEVGIRRARCVRCGEQACHQWQICADHNRWRAVCAQCDITLNNEVLRIMQDPNALEKMRAYRNRFAK